MDFNEITLTNYIFFLGICLCDEDYFMVVALLSAERSKDPERQVSKAYINNS